MASLVADPWRRGGTRTKIGRALRRNGPALHRISDRTRSLWLPVAAAQSIALASRSNLPPLNTITCAKPASPSSFPATRSFPSSLLEIYDPPLALYLKGNAEVIDKPGIAIVGTRHPTPYGVGMAERLACDLAAAGLVIFSGMARGVDSARPSRRPQRPRCTVADLGTGIDEVYPRKTESSLTKFWTLVEQFCPSSPWAHFPRRRTFPSATGSLAASRSAS